MMEITRIAITKNEETGRIEIVLPYKLMGQVDLKFTTDVVEPEENEACECEDYRECEDTNSLFENPTVIERMNELKEKERRRKIIEEAIARDIKEKQIMKKREEIEIKKWEMLKEVLSEIQ